MKSVLLSVPLLFVASQAVAGESTIVLQDNTRITTREVYMSPKMGQFEVETDDSFGFAQCIDQAKRETTRQKRFKAIQDCQDHDNNIAIGGLA